MADYEKSFDATCRRLPADRSLMVQNPEQAIGEPDAQSLRGHVDTAIIAQSGGLFVVFLSGWVDDRLAPLHQLRIIGDGWAGSMQRDELGRSRRSDVETSVFTAQGRLLGFWGLAIYDPGKLDGGVASIEIVLADGTLRSVEVVPQRCAEMELRSRVHSYLQSFAPADRQLPLDVTAFDRMIGRWAAEEEAQAPRGAVDAIMVGREGGIFIAGWIDDTHDELDEVRLSGSGWIVTFAGTALGRVYREDVQSALGVARPYPFGNWGFAGARVSCRPGSKCSVELLMKGGARRRFDLAVRVLDSAELVGVALTYLGSCRFLGNPQIDAVACIAGSIGQQLVDLNLAITRRIASRPHVERFGARRGDRKGSIIVCLYGRPEYLFLQNALFSAGSGIEDYELIYVCNSPELAEGLLRDARTAATAYGLDLTLILLPGNAGFGTANNVGVEHARTNRVMMVNPDVFPFDCDWAAKHAQIVDQLPSEQTHVFGVPLYYADGSLMHAGMYIDSDVDVSFRRSAFRRETLLRVEHYGKGAPPFTPELLLARPVPAVTGAFMSWDRGWLERLGGFSEDYVWGHYEDADLCLRSIDSGIAPWIHDVKLWHLEGKGSAHPPALGGVTTVNRWLFTKRWASAVDPDLLGPSPSHRLLVAGSERVTRSSKPAAVNGANSGYGQETAGCAQLTSTYPTDGRLTAGAVEQGAEVSRWM